MVNNPFYEYELDGKKIAFHAQSKIEVQLGKGKSSYKTKYSFAASDFGRAVMHYNMLNTHSGYKKRLVCFGLNKPILARSLS